MTKRDKLLHNLVILVGCYCSRFEKMSIKELKKEIKYRKKIRDGKVVLF